MKQQQRRRGVPDARQAAVAAVAAVAAAGGGGRSNATPPAEDGGLPRAAGYRPPNAVRSKQRVAPANTPDRFEREVLGGRLWHPACQAASQDIGDTIPLSFASVEEYVGTLDPLVLEEAREGLRADWAEGCASGGKSWAVEVVGVEEVAGGWAYVRLRAEQGHGDMRRACPNNQVVVLTDTRPPPRGAIEWAQALVRGGGRGAGSGGRASKRQRREASAPPNGGASGARAPSASVDSCGGEDGGEMEEPTADSGGAGGGAEEAAGWVVAGLARRSVNDLLVHVHPACAAHAHAPDACCWAALRALQRSSAAGGGQRRRWWLVPGRTLISSEREFDAVHRVRSLQSSLLRFMLKPELLAPIGAYYDNPEVRRGLWPEQAAQPAFIHHLRKLYDETQLEAIEMAACHLGAPDPLEGGAAPHPLLPFVLIQGPPGTGKTHTVKGMLNVWHLVAFQRYYDGLIAATEPAAAPQRPQAAPARLNAAGSNIIDAVTSSMLSDLGKAVAQTKPRILVCTPSNAACDELLTRVMTDGFADGSGRTYRPNVIRVGSAIGESVNVTVRNRLVGLMVERYRNMSQGDWQHKFSDLKQRHAHVSRELEALELSLTRAVRAAGAGGGAAAAAEAAGQLTKEQAQMQELSKKLVERAQLQQRLANELERMGLARGMVWGQKEDWRVREAEQSIEASFLSEAEMVFTTLSSTQRKVFAQSASKIPFHTVLIDEAGQASEVAALQPLCFGAKRVVLVGDPQQLPATILSELAKQVQMERSLFERLQQRGAPVKMLSVQYRMHPAIRQFPSAHFYQGRLRDADSIQDMPPAPFYGHPLMKPYVFFDVSKGQEQRREGGGSLSNRAEALLAACLFAELRQFLIDLVARQPGALTGPTTVGVITPYKEQRNLLRKVFEDVCGKGPASEVFIETVDSFQGKQLDVVILSCVRASSSGGIGFVNDVRRLNVAITRAKRALWVLGSRATLRAGNAEWAALISDAEERGVVIEDADAKDLLPDLPYWTRGDPRAATPDLAPAGQHVGARDTIRALLRPACRPRDIHTGNEPGWLPMVRALLAARRRRRRQRRSAPLGAAATALLAALALAYSLLGAGAAVAPVDKAALLAFKAGLTAEGGELLSTWSPDSDPCGASWMGVRCSCDDFFAVPNDPRRAKVCSAPPELEAASAVALPGPNANAGNATAAAGALPAAFQRVLQLNFGDPRITTWNTLTGTISPALGNLTALRVLNLNANHLYGSLPRALRRLRSLEQLLLSGNRLTGRLPPYLGSFAELRYVRLDNNQFTGPLPWEWCNGSWWQFDVAGNAGLCDEVQPCLRDRISSFDGTSLIDSVNDQDKGTGGYCEVDPPTCGPKVGCRILSPDPPYFTNATGVAFAFSAFRSPLGGGEVRYRWAIGTTRWGRDVLDWVPFEGRKATEELKTPRGTVAKVVYYVDWPLAQVSLTSGVQYFITVQGSNDAGQVLGTMLSSQPIVADVTPPYQPEGSSVFSGQGFSNVAAQAEVSALAASWDPFVDEETGIEFYSYQVFNFVNSQGGTPGYVGDAVTNKTQLNLEPDQGEFRVYVINLDLKRGSAYFMRIYATNGAGLEGYKDAPPVVVGGNDCSGGGAAAVSVSKVVILVAVFVGAASALVALVTYWLMRESMRRHQAARKRMRGQMKNFKYLMQSLVQQVGDAEERQLEELKQLRELAFVITDLQDSTAIAAAAPRQFEKVQEMHDSLLRELIGRYHGYEINTEGDAFHVAFKDVQHAVAFCMEVQYQMLELDWPREVLRLGSCREVKAPDGTLVYRGPRIRMGIHWASKGTVVQRLHQITKHRVFTGPAFQVARELSEAAQGGQVLLSHEGWVRLRQDMATAGFPVVEQLGLYKVESWPAPVWVYQVTQLLERPLHRQPLPISFLEALEAGWGMSINQPPMPRGPKGHLAFVACRLALEACPGGAAGEASPAIAKRLHELLAMVAMQFGGYLFRLSESQAAFLLAFTSPVDGVRFCHSAQALLMYSQWGADCAEFCGRTELAPDGKPTFKGPRVAMAVHQSCEFSAVSVPRQQAAADDVTTDYLGTAVERVQQLSEAAHGGQVIVSEKAWAAVQDQLPGAPHVVSLGSHLLDHSNPASPPLLLIEVMPQVLSRRMFPPPRTLGMVEPGYRDAPGADEPVAFVYAKVSKPAEVLEAEQVRPAVSDDTIIRVLTAYNVAVSKATKLMRTLLRQHGGYECKEPEPGKMTLAFKCLEDAVEWGCALQLELMGFAWPDTVLEWGECAEQRDPDTTNLLWRGLRLKLGISYGLPSSKAPLNTGRADYFGSVPNLAARLMAVARPGQLLVDGRLGSMRDLQWRDDGGAILLSRTAGPVEFTQLGYLQVKGLDDPKLVFQVAPARLRGRQHEDLPTTAATARGGPYSARGGGSLAGSRPLSLRRAGSVDVGSEATPRQGSATSVRTPSLKRYLTGHYAARAAAAYEASGTAPRGRLRAGLLSMGGLGRRHSMDTMDEGGQYGSAPGQYAGRSSHSEVPPDARSLSVASSGGSLARASWLATIGHRLTGVLGRRGGHSGQPSELGSPRSAVDVMLPLTSRSGTTGSNAASFTAANPLFMSQHGAPGGPGAPLGATLGAPGMGAPHRSASAGILPQGVPVGVGGGALGGSRVGSFASDSTLAAAAAAATSGGTTPLGGHASGRNSPPLTASRLRDAADWSYPGSTLTTPTTQATGDGNVDHWDKGLEMEAALGSTAAAGVAGAPDGVGVAAPARHHSATGLPPRGPQHHPLPQRVISSVLDAALAAVAGRGGRDGAGEAGGVSAPALLPDGRAHSGSNPPAMLDLSAAIERGGYATPAELSAEEEAAAADAAAMPPPPPQQPSGGLPPWQSPARVPPVPPLPLSRISGSSRGSAGSEPPDLLPPPPLAAPLGLQPPVPQPALWSRGRPGGGIVGPGAGARRPPGLTLDTEGLTFETFGLESPDTITPGLQYARQVAQLFVEGRRRSGTSMAGGGTVTTHSFDKVEQSAVPVVVEFFAPWCGHCKSLAPVYTAAAEKLQGIVPFVAVDCDREANRPLCGRFGVQGFPTIKLFTPGASSPVDYQGPREAKPLANAAVGLLTSKHVQRVNDLSDLQALMVATDKTKVVLVTDKTSTPPMFKSLSQRFAGTHKGLLFAEVVRTAASKPLLEAQGVTGAPTLLALPAGQGPEGKLVYSGQMKAPQILEWMKGLASQQAGDGKAEGKPAGKESKAKAAPQKEEENKQEADEGQEGGKAGDKSVPAEIPQVVTNVTASELTRRLDKEGVIVASFFAGSEGACREGLNKLNAAVHGLSGLATGVQVDITSAKEAATVKDLYTVELPDADASGCQMTTFLIPFDPEDHEDSDEWRPYDGPLASRDLHKAALELFPAGGVTPLTEGVYREWAGAEPQRIKVVLFTEKDEPPAVYRALSFNFRRFKFDFGLVSAGEAALREQFSVSKLPTLLALYAQPDPKAKPDEQGRTPIKMGIQPYQGPIRYGNIASWLTLMGLQTGTAPDEILEQFTGGRQRGDSMVAQIVDQESWQGSCLDKGGVCVVAALSGGEAQQAQQLEVLRGVAAGRSDQPLHFCWFQAGGGGSAGGAFASGLGLEAGQAPALAAVATKKGRGATMTGRFAKELISEWLDGLLSGKVRTAPLPRLPDFPAPTGGDGGGGGAGAEEAVEEEFDLSDIMGEEIEGDLSKSGRKDEL
ncbi:Helicase sen1 [Micractinium conductrix]|uniref:Helicase sen1 n=1 Tax=Micractinium conductrix TaxID=554055 RepID=A0A2P6VM64_9CHLO|nr:Helicase sen1 [Micractinium conductrix]|eukprot:PSC75196.1 Helicase sen1 [Micractinium conductrix]